MNLITDRTEEDVLRGTEKGHYGYKDLNRVEKAVQELCVLASGLDIPQLTIKTDWGSPGDFTQDTWPTESQMARYIGNVHFLCDRFAVQAPLPANMQNLTVENANNIERALELVYNRIMGVLYSYKYSGELYAGEE